MIVSLSPVHSALVSMTSRPTLTKAAPAHTHHGHRNELPIHFPGDTTAMPQPVIDTLRLADRLKESGFEDRQAEGLARALGSEITEHVVTKADLDAAIELVRGDYRALDEKICNKFESVDAKLESVDARFEAVDARFEAVDSRIDGLDAKFEARFDALSMQIRFIFAMLGVLLVLGLVDTVPALLA